MQLAIVAAGFTPGEADQLRRAMAAWRRKGGLEPFEQRLIDGHARARLPAGVRASASSSRSRASASTASPSRTRRASRCSSTCRRGSSATSRRRSAPRCSTASRWASTRRRSSCRTRAGTASRCGRSTCTASDWDCTLEPRAGSGTGGRAPGRCGSGLRMVKGLSRGAARRACRRRAHAQRRVRRRRGPRAPRPARPRATSSASPRPARCTRSPGTATGASGTSPASRRRSALLREAALSTKRCRCCAAPSEGEDIVADYASLGLTLGRHPLALLRARLAALRLVTAAELRRLPHGRIVRTAGLVTCRQRPDTASGVTFVTLEDETGCVNVIVWRDARASASAASCSARG